MFESQREREYVYVNRTIYDGPIHPSAEELDGGRFWSLEEIRAAIGQQILNPTSKANSCGSSCKHEVPINGG